jgi:hypothetical protein
MRIAGQSGDRGVVIVLGGQFGIEGAFGALAAHIQPTCEKNTAKNASSTITMKIACTTACVVRSPPRNCPKPASLIAACHRHDHAEHRPLDQPHPQVDQRHHILHAKGS